MHRTEYPRPEFAREKWQCLNGQWRFAFDDERAGLDDRWERKGLPGDQLIEVPFAFQSPLSGITDPAFHDEVWYSRTFEVPSEWAGQRVMLNFGAVDYACRVFVNGDEAGTHVGGSIGFSLDVTRLLVAGKNVLTVWVCDPSEDESIPRGKQDWLEKSHGIWYTRTTGIWQSVWMEPVSAAHIQSAQFTPDIDHGMARMEALFAGDVKGMRLRVEVSFRGEVVLDDVMMLTGPKFTRELDIFGQHIFRTDFHGAGWCWSPEHPNLLDVKLTLIDGAAVIDEVNTYFGMRKIHTEAGMVFLNNRPYYQKLVLDQGYWPEGLLTAPTDEAFKADIEMMKAMGFNGARKHQKSEDPRFLYWADKLGFIVWGEIASAPSFSQQAVRNLTIEFMEQVMRDYNHPCIVTWVPFNESWGVPRVGRDAAQQAHVKGLVNTVKAMDGSRLVVSNDGWEQVGGDICAIHNYAHGGPNDKQKFAQYKERMRTREVLLADQPCGRMIYAEGSDYEGQPILLTEFGGIAYKPDGQAGWGYTSATTQAEFLAEYARVMSALYASEALAGFCYTQLSDVEQEVNGLVSYDRKPKANPAKIKQINDSWHPSTILDI